MLATDGNQTRQKQKPYRISALLVVVGLALSACGSDASDAAGADAESGRGDAGNGTSSTTETQLADSGVPSLGSVTTVDTSSEDSSDASTDAPVLDGNSSEDEIFAVWQTCMIGEGINDLVGMTVADIADLAAFDTDPAYTSASRVCDELINDAFGSFELDPATKAALADRSVKLAACGREFLEIEIPDDILFLSDDDPRLVALESMETTPEQDEAIEACLQEALGDLLDEDGNVDINKLEEDEQ